MAADNRVDTRTAEQLIGSCLVAHAPVYETMDLSVSDGIYTCVVPLSVSTGNPIATIHATFQFALTAIAGGLVVLCNRTDDQYVPVMKSLTIDFKCPALSGISFEAYFRRHDIDAMNRALEATDRYDFELDSTLRDQHG